MKKILQNNRGETIVEVLVSFVLLLMFTAMFVVSLRYARTMARKAETLRDTAYAFCAGLYPVKDQLADWEPVPGKENMSIDFGVFVVKDVELDSVEVEAEVTTTDENGGTNAATEKHTFHRYSNANDTAQEGTGGTS